MFKWIKRIIGWEREISGEVVSNYKRISRSKRNSSHKVYYDLRIEHNGIETRIICWRSNLWPREWKIIREAKKHFLVRILARKKWFSKYSIAKRVIESDNGKSWQSHVKFTETWLPNWARQEE